MSKRQEYRERIQKQKKRNRLIIIFSIAGVAVLIAGALILQQMKQSNPGSINQVTPVAYNVPENGTSLGDPNAPVKMDVWEDFQCSGCYYYTTNIEAQVLQTFVETGKVYYTFHYYPFIDGGSGESHDAADAAACAAAQNRFWDFHAIAYANWLGENSGSFTKARLQAFAQAIGLDMNAFNSCYDANTYASTIQNDVTAGDQIGVPPTPGLFVDGKAVVSSSGPNYIPSFDDISNVINTALNGG
jgi:protein-disulfide isomerase